MITMFQFPEGLDLPVSVSPYCAKTELYFRLTDRPYRTEIGNVLQSPNKLVPYVAWSDGTVSAESEQIIARLEADGPALDDGLSDDDRLRGAALVDLAQDALYFGCLYSRFADPEGWRHQKPTVRRLTPWPLRPILVPVIRRSQVRKCAEAGFRQDGDLARSRKVAEELSDALGSRPYLLGDRPRTADCGVWANLMQCAYSKNDTEARAAVRDDPRLMAYVHRLADEARLELPALA